MDLANAEALLRGLADRPLLFLLVVVLMSWLLEDATALAVGALASAMAVPTALAVTALMVGTVSGDMLLHGAGKLARRHPRVEAWLPRDGRLARFGRAPVAVVAARFVPGLRLPVYVGSGLAGMNSWHFALLVTATALLWVPLIFRAGQVTGAAPPLFIAALLLLLLAPRLLRRPAGWLLQRLRDRATP